MNTTTRDITEKVIEGLRKAAIELEEFQLQFALGKADATDIYEEVKKEFKSFLHDSSIKIDKGMDKAEEFKARLEELQLQLALGKADTKDAFIEQKEKIQKTIEKIEYLIKHNKVNSEYIPALKLELEKFKVKMDVLYTKYNIESKKKAFTSSIEELKNKYFTKDNSNSWDHFSGEIEESFKHFKNAFKL